ncbi:MAG TPA: HAMP domain-containing sensor histidine kinase [Alphaproteobacteria bacterium]|nr:HAMP domain-containing sensor histidine kinase [Alphaproteobacteria bacterium]
MIGSRWSRKPAVATEETPSAPWGCEASPIGLSLSRDPLFAPSLRAPLARDARKPAVLHACRDLREVQTWSARENLDFAVVDGRGTPSPAGGDLAAISSLAPCLPVIVCVNRESDPALRERLWAGGAFEILSGPPWPESALLAAVRHAAWIALGLPAASPAKQASGVESPDRPLLAEISHEMLSPLNAIIGFAQAIEHASIGRWSSAQQQYRDYAANIRRSSEHLRGLFEDLLTVGDAETVAIPCDDRIEPAVLAKEIADAFAAPAKERSLTLHLEICPDATAFRGNRRLLLQSLFNLVQNAIKYTPEGGSITVTVAQSAEETVFTVADSGIGMDPVRLGLPRRLRNSAFTEPNSRPVAGHGLGLQFVERVMAAHGGSLAIDSRPGEGARIRISVPHMALPAGSIG